MNDRFGSTARDFAAGIVTREGGTPEDVRELSYGPDLDRIVSDHRAEFDWNTVPGMVDWQRCVGQVLRGRVPVR